MSALRRRSRARPTQAQFEATLARDLAADRAVRVLGPSRLVPLPQRPTLRTRLVRWLKAGRKGAARLAARVRTPPRPSRSPGPAGWALLAFLERKRVHDATVAMAARADAIARRALEPTVPVGALMGPTTNRWDPDVVVAAGIALALVLMAAVAVYVVARQVGGAP